MVEGNLRHGRDLFIGGEWKTGDESQDKYPRFPTGLAERIYLPDPGQPGYGGSTQETLHTNVHFNLNTVVKDTKSMLPKSIPKFKPNAAKGSWDRVVSLH